MTYPEHAVVLSGGGANGAYEVGVMEALFSGRCRQGKRVSPSVFVGTSVGSYNAAAMVSLSEWGCLAAVRQLRELWLERIASHNGRPNGVFRLRGSITELPRDLLDVGGNWLRRGVDLAFSADAPTRRALRLLDGCDLISTSPLESLIADTLDSVRLIHSKSKLRIVACNWDTGDPVVFYNNPDPQDGGSRREKRAYQARSLTEDNVKQAILASTAIPAIFPRVQMEDAYFVDGGVVMNTPLTPAIDAGASVLHVIHLEPKLAPLPLGRAPSALESLERILSATPARLIDADIRYAALENRIADAERSRTGHPGALSGPPNEFARRRPIEIHRYYPRGQIGGMIGLLDFERERMIDLIERGFREAVEHDCVKNHCVIQSVSPVPAVARAMS